MTIHSFGGQLAYSHSQADAPWWRNVYQQAFPDMVQMVDLRHDGWQQRAGRDRMIILSSGRPIYIDEKVRRGAWTDIAVEIWSRYPVKGEAPYPSVPAAEAGWGVKPLDCDFVAYALAPLRTCYLIPFLGLRAATTKHGDEWAQRATAREGGFRWVRADNWQFVTISIAVPIQILQSCIADALTIHWPDEETP